MEAFFQWFTRMENSKVLALILFFIVFCAILIYLYSSKNRSERLESYKHMPLNEADDELPRRDQDKR